MSNSIDKCLNVIRIRHYRKQGATTSPKWVNGLGFLTGADRLRLCEGLASDALDYHPRGDASGLCIECATYAASERDRRSVSVSEVCAQVARRWDAEQRKGW
jgi:hypothetical protein